MLVQTHAVDQLSYLPCTDTVHDSQLMMQSYTYKQIIIHWYLYLQSLALCRLHTVWLNGVNQYKVVLMTDIHWTKAPKLMKYLAMSLTSGLRPRFLWVLHNSQQTNNRNCKKMVKQGEHACFVCVHAHLVWHY